MNADNQPPSEPKHLGPDLDDSPPCMEVFMIHNNLYGCDRFATPPPNHSQVLPDYKRKRHHARSPWAN